MKKLLIIVAAMVTHVYGAVAGPYTGFYQTIDDKTNSPKSIVALYEYKDGGDTELAGRVVALYGANGQISETIANPIKTADKIKGTPKISGLDIIWDMAWDAGDNRYTDGKIMDPQSGKVYSSVIWSDGGDTLNVRGKIGPIGRTQKWKKLDASALPSEIKDIDTTNWTPKTRK